MAKTVGYPAALGAELILQGQLKGKGVIAPVMMEAFDPILKRLKDCGIECREEDISL
jgi:saccharopine dehydrogenase-like NADP-dependent oxidoreductase